jgi:hypothetical protein
MNTTNFFLKKEWHYYIHDNPFEYLHKLGTHWEDIISYIRQSYSSGTQRMIHCSKMYNNAIFYVMHNFNFHRGWMIKSINASWIIITSLIWTQSSPTERWIHWFLYCWEQLHLTGRLRSGGGAEYAQQDYHYNAKPEALMHCPKCFVLQLISHDPL